MKVTNMLFDVFAKDVVHCDSSVDGSLLVSFTNGDIVVFGNMITGHRYWRTPNTTGAAPYCDYCGDHEARHMVSEF